MLTSDLQEGMLLRLKEGRHIFYDEAENLNQLVICREDDNFFKRYVGREDCLYSEGEILLYLGDGFRPFKPPHVPAEVMWRGKIFRVRQQDWQYFEPIR